MICDRWRPRRALMAIVTGVLRKDMKLRFAFRVGAVVAAVASWGSNDQFVVKCCACPGCEARMA